MLATAREMKASQDSKKNNYMTGFLPRGAGAPLPEAVCLPQRLLPLPEIWFENNRKISITKEICITIDFAP